VKWILKKYEEWMGFILLKIGTSWLVLVKSAMNLRIL
jgi:hypothetical protein